MPWHWASDGHSLPFSNCPGGTGKPYPLKRAFRTQVWPSCYCSTRKSFLQTWLSAGWLLLRPGGDSGTWSPAWSWEASGQVSGYLPNRLLPDKVITFWAYSLKDVISIWNTFKGVILVYGITVPASYLQRNCISGSGSKGMWKVSGWRHERSIMSLIVSPNSVSQH